MIIRGLLLVSAFGTAQSQLSCSSGQEICCPDGTALASSFPPCSSGPPECVTTGTCGSGTSTITYCDACGASATYSEAIDTSGSVATRTITSTGCPNHYSICTGKAGLTGCGGIGEEGTASEAKDQSKAYVIPANPVIASATTSVACDVGAIGIALNGVSLYSGAVDASCNLLDTTDDTSEWTAFDMCSGHSEMTGDYHYHFPPSCLIAQAEATNPTASGHSPQIGWAQDGFPIYGPLYTGGVVISQDNLDDCSGNEEELPAIDNFKYRYYFTGDTSNLRALPSHPKPAEADYPFVFACMKGCTYATMAAGSCSSSGDGFTASYTASATTGYTDQFVGYGAATSVNWEGGTVSSSFINDYGTCAEAGVSTHGPIPAPTEAPLGNVPTQEPTLDPVPQPTMVPVPSPTSVPVPSPTPEPTPDPFPAPTSVPVLNPTLVPVPSPTSSPTLVPTKLDTATVEVSLSLTALAPATNADKSRLKTKISNSTGIAEADMKNFAVASSSSRVRRRLTSVTWTVSFDAVSSLADEGAASAEDWSASILTTLTSSAFVSAVSTDLGLTVDTSSVSTAVDPRIDPSSGPTSMPVAATAASTSTTATSTPSEEDDDDSGIDAATLTGAVVGLVAFVLVLGGFAFFRAKVLNKIADDDVNFSDKATGSAIREQELTKQISGSSTML